MINSRKLSISAMMMVLLSGSFLALAAEEHKGDAHAGHMLKCAMVCADCQVQCDACFHHCASLVTEGKKEHAHCMHLCVDCGEYCKLCSTLCARKSGFSGIAAEGCAKVCDECAAACEKFPQDEHMAACAKTCRKCAKECRDMVKMSKSDK